MSTPGRILWSGTVGLESLLDKRFAAARAGASTRISLSPLDDAAAQVQGTLSQDTRNRLPPGDGVFDLPRAVAALAAIDALRWVGPEVISPQTEAMSGQEAGELTGRLVRDLVTTHGGARP